MANSIFQKLAVAAAGTVLSLNLMEANPAQAAIITYDFTVDVTSGLLFGNQYRGYFSYDDSAAGPYFLPIFDVSDFYFEFDRRIFTTNDLRYAGCRYGIQYCFPLEITGGEAVLDQSGYPLYLTPRGGQLTSFSFSNVDMFGPSPYSLSFSLFGSSSSGIFYYQLPVDVSAPYDPDYQGNGTVKLSLRQTPTPPPASVPEPGTIFGLIILGLGWLLRKKKVSSQST